MSAYAYAVILGVNLDDQRQAALELGPYPNATRALEAAADSIGRTVRAVTHKHGARATPYYETIAAHLPVAGFTLERFTEDGTDSDWRIEESASRVTPDSRPGA